MKTIVIFALLCAVVAISFVDAADDKIAVGCLGNFPVEISKAIKDCNLSPPSESRKKRKAPKATEPPMPDGKLTDSDKKNLECLCNKLNLINSDGIDSTNVRRLMDKTDNYPMGEKQIKYWRKVKDCGFKASDKRKDKPTQIEFFVNCLTVEYNRICS